MATKGGRKYLMIAAMDERLTLQQGQSIVQVVSLRGNNLIEIDNEKGEKALAIFPAKFQKSMWIKTDGNYLLGIPCYRPEIFKYNIDKKVQASTSVHEDSELNSSDDDDDDGLLPLQANTNRRKALEFPSDSDSDFDKES